MSSGNWTQAGGAQRPSVPKEGLNCRETSRCSQTDGPGCRWAGLPLCEMGMTCPGLLRAGAEHREASGPLSGEGRPAPLGLVLGGCGRGRHGLGGLTWEDWRTSGTKSPKGWGGHPDPLQE